MSVRFEKLYKNQDVVKLFLLTAHMMSLDLSAYIILMIIRAFLSCNRKVYYIGQFH